MDIKLKDIIAVLKDNDLLVEYDISGLEDVVIRSITYDSKQADEGCLFVCKGAAFKKEYLQDAMDRGSLCYVSETDYEINAPRIKVNDIRRAMPYIAESFYQIPDSLCRIGITGTKGKTTCSYYMKKMFDTELERKAEAGKCHETGFITTVETFDGVERKSTGITTPESFVLYKHFQNACSSGIEKVIMEISSQALKYRRTQGIRLDTALFLNISEDHISPNEHADFEDYFESKLKIFEQCKNAVICSESDHFDRVIEKAKSCKNVENIITYGFDESVDVRGYDLKEIGSKTEFSISYKGMEYACVLNMRGDFNVLNALAVAATGFIYGVDYKDIKAAFEDVSVPGRGEEYSSKDKKLNCIVDYAHNGFSFRSIISMAKKSWPNGRVVTVFGCPGGKAFNRRKDLGLAAGELSDFIYLTADDPAKEDINKICDEIAVYVKEAGCEYTVVPDRTQAIFKAVEEAAACEGETVLMILGKGCETTQKTANGNEAYESDAVVVQEAINRFFI